MHSTQDAHHMSVTVSAITIVSTTLWNMNIQWWK